MLHRLLIAALTYFSLTVPLWAQQTQVQWGYLAGFPSQIQFKVGPTWFPIGTFDGVTFSPAGVTSVGASFTGGLVSISGSPITGAGTFGFTVAGTSGGTVCFTSASTWAASSALVANAIMVGGGAGVCPSTTTTGAGVLAALGVAPNVSGGFAKVDGAPVVGHYLQWSAGGITDVDPAGSNVSGSAQTTTANCSAASATVTLASAIDFANGQGIGLEHCGAAFTASPPTGLTVAASGSVFQGPTGATTYAYRVSCIDEGGGVGAAITAVSIADGAATLGVVDQSTRQITYNHVSWSAGAGCVGYAVWRSKSAGAYVLLGAFGSEGGNFVNDTDLPTVSIAWLPTTPPASALADRLVSTISSGAGTTTLVVADAATTDGTGVVTHHDDTVALTAHLTSNPVATLPPGTYNVAGFTLPTSVQTLNCANPGSTIIQGWDGAGFALVATGMPTGFTFTNCTVNALGLGNGHGMLIDTTTNAVVKDSIFSGTLGLVSTDNTGLSIIGNKISSYYYYGIEDAGGTQNIISNNNIATGSLPVDGQGINITNSFGPSVTGNTVLGNTLFGIDINTSDGAHICDNKIFGTLAEGLHAAWGMSNFQFCNNLVEEDATSLDFCLSVSDDGVSGQPISSGYIFGNHLVNCGMSAISISYFGGASNITWMNIGSNWIISANADNQGYPDIDIAGATVTHTFIHENTFVNGAGPGQSVYNIAERDSTGFPNFTQVGVNYGDVTTAGYTSLTGANSVTLSATIAPQ